MAARDLVVTALGLRHQVVGMNTGLKGGSRGVGGDRKGVGRAGGVDEHGVVGW
jgi:hypothetical protein